MSAVADSPVRQLSDRARNRLLAAYDLLVPANKREFLSSFACTRAVADGRIESALQKLKAMSESEFKRYQGLVDFVEDYGFDASPVVDFSESAFGDDEDEELACLAAMASIEECGYEHARMTA